MKRKISEIYSLNEIDFINSYNINKKSKKDNTNINKNNVILEFNYDNKYKFCSINNNFIEKSFIENINICNLSYILQSDFTLKINISNNILEISNFDFIAYYINNIYESIYNNSYVNEQTNNHNYLLNLLYNLKSINDTNKINKLKNSNYTRNKNIYDVFNQYY